MRAAIGLFAGVTATAVLVALALSTDHASFAKGLAIGGGVAIVALAVLFWRGARGGAAARIASGNADEREQHIAREALADTGAAMFLSALVMTIATLWDVEAIAVGGIVLWTGVITFVTSVAVRSRRG